MSYDEEEVINDSGFNPNENGDEVLDDESFLGDNETPDGGEASNFRFEEEETEGVQ